jgi:phosphoglucomutase
MRVFFRLVKLKTTIMKMRGGEDRKTGAVKIAFGTSGWRGRLDQDFTLSNVRRVAQGVADYYKERIKKGSILVGFDPRKNNPDFARETSRILAANGVPVKIIIEEPTPTPVLAYLANTDEGIAGVVNLTASHNRYTDNGFKFSPHHGGAADKSTTDAISKYANEACVIPRISYESARSIGLVEEFPLREALDRYVDGYVVPTLNQLKAWESIIDFIKSDKAFNVIIDPMQGASARYMEAIYRKLELEVGRSFVELLHGNNDDPRFTEVNGAPNPTETENIKDLIERVHGDSNTLGIAVDGDGDRFGVIDLGGEVMQGNEIIALLTYFLANKGLVGVVGKTVATSSFVEAVANHMGLELVETPVGFKWFVEKATKSGVNFLVAGEESAHVGVGPFMKSWDDGIVIGILCLWMVADKHMSLTSYRGEVEAMLGRRFFYNRDSVELSPKLKEKAAALINGVREERALGTSLEGAFLLRLIESFGSLRKVEAVITVDGLKVRFASGEWFCIRLSGTENVARIYTEAKDPIRLSSVQYTSRALLGVSPEAQLSELSRAAGKQIQRDRVR